MASWNSSLIITWLLSLVIHTTATNGTYEVHNITRFGQLKFENLAVRSNGQIIATISAPTAMLYLVDPVLVRPPTLIYTFTDVQHVTGIYELSPNIFYVAGGNWTLTDPDDLSPRSLGLYKVDMRQFYAWPDGTVARESRVQRVASVPHGGLLNGLTSIDGQESDFLFVADTFAGLIWRVDIFKGNVEVALNDSTTTGSSSNPSGPNGVKVFNSTLYYTNTGKSALYKVPIDSAGRITGQPTMITNELPCDDLILDWRGNAYVAGPADMVMKVTPDGEKSVIAGTFNSTKSALVGPTALAFGRMATDWMSLYVTTNGGALNAVNGTQGVSRIDVLDFPSSGVPLKTAMRR